MKSIQRKLNNKDGVSILIALVGFLAACMIAAVIVSAAVTSAKRVANDKTENQAHLTLESAAQIVRDGITDTKYTYNDADHTAGSADGTFEYEMENAVEMTDSFSGTTKKYDSSEYSRNFTVTLASEDSGAIDEVKTVKGSFIMDSNYNLTVTLCIDDTDEKMYIDLNGNISEDGKTITWKAVSINERGEQDANADE